MRKRLNADRVAPPVSSATANALSASPMMLRPRGGWLDCWLALPPPPRRLGLGEGNPPNAPPPVGPRPLPGALASPLADRTLLRAPVLECAIAAPVIATAAAPAPNPTPTAAKSPPVKVVAPPKIAEASLGDIQH